MPRSAASKWCVTQPPRFNHGPRSPAVAVLCRQEANGWGMSQEERPKPIGSVELAKLTAPIYTHVIECFGPERCMWESNFPVRIRLRAQCCHALV